ncbi:hypothetical protein YO5_17110 [Stutzerimonas stutzeri TS44]|nr:hypothetical protein YO5_17110 [Stutzerimonas stutzeri TS44]
MFVTSVKGLLQFGQQRTRKVSSLDALPRATPKRLKPVRALIAICLPIAITLAAVSRHTTELRHRVLVVY